MKKQLFSYLSDWKNWLTHGIVGVLFLLAAIFVPVSVYIKIPVVVLVVALNIFRMRKFSQKA